MFENKTRTKRHCDCLKVILVPLKSLCSITKFQIIIYPLSNVFHISSWKWMNEQSYQRSDILVVHDKSEIFMGKFDYLILKIKYNFIQHAAKGETGI